MAQQFEYLFSPIKLGPVTIPNRIVFAPHGQSLADMDNLPTERQAYYFAERAKGGVGLIVLGGSLVMRNCIGFPFRNIVSDERSIPGYRRIAEMVHEHGTKIFAQLSHQGRQATSKSSREPLWAPSPLPCVDNREVPKEMEKEDIEEVIRNFVKGARNVREAGFDGVEVYTAHGYLLSQFLSPHSNKRADEYGGSLENRLRLHKEIITAIRQEVGKDFAIGLRMNGDDFTPGGLTHEELQGVARILASMGELTHISVSGGTYNSLSVWIADMSYPPGPFVPLAAGIKEVVDIPVACVNRITDPVQAEKILQDGQADLIAMVRPLVADPEWPKKAREGRLEDIRLCISCNQGCLARTFPGYPISCIQNPTVGFEKDWGIGTLKPAVQKKKVVVVGGGPAGMEAARVAALRGHNVRLYEKGSELGGQLNILTKNVKTREEMGGITRYLALQIKKLGVQVDLGVEVTPEMLLSENPDAVILATGSVPSRTGWIPARPDVEKLPGVDQDNVLTYWEALMEPDRVGQNVVLIDETSDYHCASTAEFLADKGKNVQIITRLPYFGMNLPPAASTPQMQRLFTRHVTFRPFTLVEAIKGNTLVLRHIYSGEQDRLEGIDTVVLVLYNEANTSLYYQLKGKVRELYRVGDCLAPRRTMDAIFDAHKVARSL